MRTLADRRQISALFVHHGPVILARDADASGISRSVLRRSADRGELTRLGKAAFVSTSAYAAASPWEAFRLRFVAFSLSSGPDTFLTGPAAAAVLDIPMHGKSQTRKRLRSDARHGSPPGLVPSRPAATPADPPGSRQSPALIS
jgi:hypothetical protein